MLIDLDLKRCDEGGKEMETVFLVLIPAWLSFNLAL